MESYTRVSQFKEHAEVHLPKNARDYYSSGATDMMTLLLNDAAYDEFAIVPRPGSGITVGPAGRPLPSCDTTTTVLGRTISSPIAVAATAMQKMAHPDGEMGTVAAARDANTIHVLSSFSTSTIEAVASVSPGGFRWFQLYVYNDRELTASIVRRAEAAGYTAIVMTVDTPILGRREPDVRNKFKLPSHLSLSILEDAGHTAESKSVASEVDSGLAAFVRKNLDQSLQWSDVAWLKSISKLPILVKGVLTREAARQAVQHGVSGIIVSNHGARQLDGVAPTLFALPEVVAEVGNEVEVFLDGGVRSGYDAFKGVALGAKAVFFGRPALWGLAAGGAPGVSRVLEIMNEEFKDAMRLAGCARIADINRDCLAARHAVPSILARSRL